MFCYIETGAITEARNHKLQVYHNTCFRQVIQEGRLQIINASIIRHNIFLMHSGSCSFTCLGGFAFSSFEEVSGQPDSSKTDYPPRL